MPVYTLNPSHHRAGTHKASGSHSLRERIALRRNSAQSADGSETYYPTSSSSSSSTQRSRASSASSAVATAQARRYAAEASGYMGNPRAKTPTRKDELQRLAHAAGYHVETYSPGDGVTRYRFFDLEEMDRKGVSMREMSYFGPLNGVDTVLGLAAAKKWLSKSHTRRRNPLSEDGAVVNPAKRRSGGRAQKAGLAKGQSLMAQAAAAYRAGHYATMQDALRGVSGGGAHRKHNPLSEDGAVVNPRRGGKAGSDVPANAVFYATTRGGRYEIIITPAGEHKGEKFYDLDDRTSGSSMGRGYNNLAGLRARIPDMLHYAKAWDGINYDVKVDTLGLAKKSNPLSEDGAVVNPRRGGKSKAKAKKGHAKRSGGRTGAQSNAARAMKLFHSGQASSLGEAWEMIRGGR